MSGTYKAYPTKNKTLTKALSVINENINDKVTHDSELQKIQRLFEQGFEVKDPTGARKINSKMLQQALWRTVNKMKFLDFQIHGAGRPPIVEKVVTDGVFTVADEGKLINSLRDKQGAFWNSAMYGDGLIMIGTEEKSKYPIKYTTISPSNVYVDGYSTGLRSGGTGKNVTEMVVVFSMSPERLVSKYGAKYPKLKNKNKMPKGRIKRYLALQKEQERKFEQKEQVEQDMVEIAFYYDIAEEKFMVFAGSENIILEEKKGKDYPFKLNGEAYIPVSQFMFIPSSEGFWNYGLGHMIYDLAVISQRMLNMAIGHLDENVYPVTLVNLPKGEAASFFNKLQIANEFRAAGKKGMVALEYDENSPGSGRISSDALTTPSLMNEWQVVFDRLDKELRRLGINLDDTGYGSNPTATQVLAEEENANAFIKQVMEQNASECKFLIEITMDFIKKFIGKKDKTPLNLTTNLGLSEGGEVDLKGVTMGMLSEELKASKYFVKINARSGSVPSNTMRQAQIARQLAITMPGSPGFVKLQHQYAQLNDLELTLDDFAAPQPQPTESPETQSIPTETDRIAPNPYNVEKAMA